MFVVEVTTPDGAVDIYGPFTSSDRADLYADRLVALDTGDPEYRYSADVYRLGTARDLAALSRERADMPNDAHKEAIELMAKTWYAHLQHGWRRGLATGSWPKWELLDTPLKDMFREAAADAHRAYHREYDRMWAE